MGAPKGNMNAVRHGTRATGLILSGTPKRYSRQHRDVCKLRRAVEAAVLGRFGAIELIHAMTIERLSLCHLRALLIDRYLREADAKLSDEMRLKLYDRSLSYREARDRAARDLGLSPTEIDAKGSAWDMGAPTNGKK